MPKTRYLTIELTEYNDYYHATEPNTNKDITGRGDTPHEAICDYVSARAGGECDD